MTQPSSSFHPNTSTSNSNSTCRPPPFLSSHRRTVSYTHAHKLKKSRSAGHQHSRRRTSAHIPISKLGSGPGPSKLSGQQHHDDGDDDDYYSSEMAVSFLNFCAMCEKQITIPDNSVLYCSASCRRKDSRKPLSEAAAATMTPTATPPSSPPLSPRTIVAPMTPTRPISSIQIPPEFHDAKTDLDPTEWKPVIPPVTGIPMASSEAWQYLSQFHTNEESMLPVRRAGAGHRSTSSLSTLLNGNGAMPPLTNTPSTVASSVSSNASDYMSYPDPARRPLPPRRNPSYSGSAGVTKGVDLVVPHVVTPSEDGVTDISNGGSILTETGAPWGKRSQDKKSAPAVTVRPVSP